MENSRLKGRTALITGAGLRIGRQIALSLANAGVNIVIHYRNSEMEADSLRRELLTRGVSAWLAQADFENLEQTRDMFKRAADNAGKVDFLINNASSFTPSSIETLEFPGLVRDIQVNAWVPFMLARFFAGHFGVGKVINLIDTRVVGYDKIHVGYILSKKMLLTMTEMLAVELAPRVTVNAVAPGLILPPHGKDQDYLEELASSVPLEQHGDARDVTDAVQYLVASDFVTGQVIFVDGGRHLAERGHGSDNHQ